MPPYNARIPDCHPDRKHHARGLCQQCYHAQRNAELKTPLKYEETTYTEQHRRYRLKHFYGITLEEYNAMLEAQGGVCAICGQGPRGRMNRLSVDHDHTTGKVRGLLCNTCNRTLGYLDNPEWLASATKYKETHS